MGNRSIVLLALVLVALAADAGRSGLAGRVCVVCRVRDSRRAFRESNRALFSLAHL